MAASILITGGLGTIGRGLSEECCKRGYRVITCDLYHDVNEVGFSLHSDVTEPTYARCDVSEFRQPGECS